MRTDHALEEEAFRDPASFVNCLAQTLSAANRYLVQLLHRAGLAHLVPSHGDILVCLFAGEPITMQELAERIHRDPSTVTALVRKLADAGYVSTQKSAHDRRRIEVSLTDEGRALRCSFECISKELLKVQMKGITKDELTATGALLLRIRDNFADACQKEEEVAS